MIQTFIRLCFYLLYDEEFNVIKENPNTFFLCQYSLFRQ